MVSSCNSHRYSRLLLLSIYYSTILCPPSTIVTAFSHVQYASSQNDAPGTSIRRSAAASAAASSATVFRGSLNSRHKQRIRRKLKSDDFAVRMDMQSSEHEPDNKAEVTSTCTDESDDNDDATLTQQQQQTYERRHFLHGMLATSAAVGVAAIATLQITDPANAYEQAYPLELQSTPYNEIETPSNSLTKLKEERLSQKKAKVASTQSELRTNPLGIYTSSQENFGLTIAGASTWALALWFATGSRSNPLVTPLANSLYDEKDEEWLSDRNDGYFGELPLEFMAILSAVFVFCGVIVDRAVYFLADGDAEVSLQLAGVSVIGGAVWEVGRLAASEKAPTREEYDRDVTLYKEFDEFASKRLIVSTGRSCHRSDVIAAFRRFNPKYRVADNAQYPLADIEIERILKAWNRQFGSGPENEMTSAGFFKGISVDDEADVFAPR